MSFAGNIKIAVFALYSGANVFLLCQALDSYAGSPAALAEQKIFGGPSGRASCAPKLFQTDPPPQEDSPISLDPQLRANDGSLTPFSLTLDKAWKAEILEALDSGQKLEASEKITARQFVILLENLSLKSQYIDSQAEIPFFNSLESAGIKLAPDFEKRDLIAIIQSYVRLKIRPGDVFIQAWRQAAFNKRKEFRSIERYGLHGLFRKMGIPPAASWPPEESAAGRKHSATATVKGARERFVIRIETEAMPEAAD